MDAVLWGLVVLLALYAGWLTLPRPVALDWERFFKLSLVTALRGPLEEREASAEQWMEAGRERVWYHPGARELERKIEDPGGYEIPFPSRPQEQALVELLRGTPPEQRLEAALAGGRDEVLYDDPAGLGADWQLAPILGPEVDWEAVAHWTPPVRAGLERRHDRTRWLLFGLDELLQPLRELVGDDRVVEVPLEADPVLDGALPELGDRAVVLGGGEGADRMVRLLRERPALRDKVLAAVSIQARFRPDWLAANFTHEGMDTELSRATPWFHLFFVGQGLDGVAASRLPHPEVPPTGRVSVEVLDLGLFPGEPVMDAAFARALVLTVTARVALSG